MMIAMQSYIQVKHHLVEFGFKTGKRSKMHLSSKITACAILGLSLSITSCTSSPEQTPSNPTEESTKTQRIVALTSLSADIISKLDPSKLVGIPDSSLLKNNPDLASIVRVSQGRTQPNLEKIIALKPDLIIGAEGFHDQILSKAQDLGLKTMVSDIHNWTSLESFYQELSTSLAQTPSVISEELKACQASVEDNTKSKPSGLILASHQPILAPNKNSWAGDLLTRFQIQNPVASMQGNAPIDGYVTLAEEAVLQSDPDVIFVVNSSPDTLESLKAKPFWNKLKAVKTNRIYTTEYYGMVNPGSIQSIQEACQKLNAL